MKSDRKRQVKTTRLKYGKDHYKKIGSKGGENSPTHFNSESGRVASRKRWDQKTKQKESTENNG